VTGQPNRDRILDAFLGIGADEVPDRVIEAALLTIDHTPQRRALRPPWRFPDMSSSMKPATFLLGAAFVALIGAAILGRAPSNGVTATPPASPSIAGPASPSASLDQPSPSASASPSGAASTTFTSPIHRYTIEIPAVFQGTPATTTWTTSDVISSEAPWVDRFFAGPTGAFVGIASQPLPSGMSATAWMDRYAARAADRTCRIEPASWADTTVSGAAGRRAEFPCDIFTGVEIVWVVDGRAWAISGDPAVVAGILESIRYK
jgi:hypothetical protein